MKTKKLIGVLFLLMSLLCSLQSVLGQSFELQDGFYVEDNSGKSDLILKVKTPDGTERQFKVLAYTNLTVKRVMVYRVKYSKDMWQVQIDALSKEKAWTKDDFVLVVKGKPYFELGKSGSLIGKEGIVFSGAVTLAVQNEAEAKLVQERLGKRFGVLPPAPVEK